MKKIKIFLVVSEESLGEDKLEISNFIRYLNETYRSYKLYFELIYDIENLEQGELFYILFENELSEKSREMFEQAYVQFKEKSNPKIATYVKQSDNPKESVLDFMKRLGDELGHYYSGYQNVDTIKLNMVMQLESLGLKEIKLESKEGKLYLNDKEWIGLENISIFKNNQELGNLKNELNKLEDSFWSLKEKMRENPDDDDILDEYAEVRVTRKKVLEKISTLEIDIMSMESSFVKMSSKGVLSKRQIYARSCLEKGDLEAAKEALSIEEIEEEAKLDLKVHEKSKESLQIHVNEFIQRADTLKLDYSNSNRLLEIEESYEKAIELENKAGLKKETLYTYATYLYNQNKFKKALENIEAYYYYLKSEKRDIESEIYHLLALIHKNLNHYKDAEKYYLEAIKIGEANDYFDEELPSLYVGLATLYKETNRYEKAIETALSMITHLEETKEEFEHYFDEDLMYGYERLADMYESQNDYETALDYYTKAMEIFKNLDMEEDDRLHYSSNMDTTLALIHQKFGELEEAVELLLSAIEKYKKLVEKNSEMYECDLAVAYINLGHAYKEMGDYEKTLFYTHQGVEMLELLSEEEAEANAYTLWIGYQNLGTFYLKLNQFEEGEYYSLKSYELANHLYEDNKDVYAGPIAYACNNLGAYYIQTGNIEDALKFSLTAEEILAPIVKENPDVYFDTLITNNTNLIRISMTTGDFKKAEKIGKETDKAIKNYFEEENEIQVELVTTYYNNMAVVNMMSGNLKQADKYVQKSLELAEELAKKNPSKVDLLAQVYSNVGQIYFEAGEKEESLKYHERATEIMENLLEEAPERYSTLLVQIYFGLAMVYKDLKRNKEAIGIMENTIELLDVLMEQNKEAWRNLFYNNGLILAQIYIDEKLFEEGFKILSKVEPKLLTSYEENKDNFRAFYLHFQALMSIVTNGLGNLEYNKGKYECAVEYFLKAINCDEFYFKETSQRKPSLATDYINLAHAYQKLERNQEALTNGLKSLRLRKELFDEDKSFGHDYVYVNQFIGFIYLNNQPKGAVPFFKKVLELKEYASTSNYSNCLNGLMKSYDKGIESSFDDIKKCRELHEKKIEDIKTYIGHMKGFLHSYAMAHYRYGLYLHKKNQKDANEYLVKSIEFMEELVKEDEKKLSSLADFYQLVVPLVEPIDKTIEYAEKAVSILEKLVLNNPSEKNFLVNAYVVLMGFYEKNNQKEEAINIKEKLEKMKIEHEGN